MYILFSSLNVVPGDPTFVGAWWIGFLASAMLSVTCALFLFPYAFELPSEYTIQCTNMTEAVLRMLALLDSNSALPFKSVTKLRVCYP